MHLLGCLLRKAPPCAMDANIWVPGPDSPMIDSVSILHMVLTPPYLYRPCLMKFQDVFTFFLWVERLHHEQIPSELRSCTYALLELWISLCTSVWAFKLLFVSGCLFQRCSKLHQAVIPRGSICSSRLFDGVLHGIVLQKVQKSTIYIETEINNTPQDQ